MRYLTLCLLTLLAGCSTQEAFRSASAALDATAEAERRLSESGVDAISGVAAVTSRLSETSQELTGVLANVRVGLERLQPAAVEIAGICSDVHASTAVLRQKVEQPVPTWAVLGFSGLAVGLLIVFLHGLFHSRKHKRLILDLHETVKHAARREV
jgi:ABC-type transporter Mla subunit MlaD